MQNSMMLFTFFLSGTTIFGQIWSKKSKYQLWLKFGAYTNWNMQNSVVMFTFSVFDRNYAFWANLVQKSKLSAEAEIWYLD